LTPSAYYNSNANSSQLPEKLNRFRFERALHPACRGCNYLPGSKFTPTSWSCLVGPQKELALAKIVEARPNAEKRIVQPE
jgi:hypothetical protein